MSKLGYQTKWGAMGQPATYNVYKKFKDNIAIRRETASHENNTAFLPYNECGIKRGKRSNTIPMFWSDDILS